MCVVRIQFHRVHPRMVGIVRIWAETVCSFSVPQAWYTGTLWCRYWRWFTPLIMNGSNRRRDIYVPIFRYDRVWCRPTSTLEKWMDTHCSMKCKGRDDHSWCYRCHYVRYDVLCNLGWIWLVQPTTDTLWGPIHRHFQDRFTFHQALSPPFFCVCTSHCYQYESFWLGWFPIHCMIVKFIFDVFGFGSTTIPI
jgi:hypothetical protein